MASFLRLTLRCPAAREEIVTAQLWALETLGIEVRKAGSDDVELLAYFPAERDGSVAPSVPGVRVVESRVVRGRDWLAAYRERATPIEVGRRFLVDPREPAEAPPAVPAGRRLLRLPARTAYGTGSHATTRLAVEYLEELPLAGATLLDVGSGSGILSFVALLLGARFVVGLEIDREAALVGAQNRSLNRLRPALVAGDLDCLGGPGFDFAVANILPGPFLHELPLLVARLASDGAAVFSGIPVERGAEVEERLTRCGLRVASRRTEDEWAAYLAEAA